MTKIHVEQGWLEGEQLHLVTGDGKYYSFKGIPYAAPPVGPLRFKAPQPPLPYKGVRKATDHGAICPQVDIFTNELKPGSEDCLFLNVYTADLKPKQPLPVMFFIHGGGYKSGSGNVEHYGPDFLVQHGVILVTINYRLEALGFLCLDTEDVPGNAGLKDQVAALRWVKKNIASFGGDPNNVTIFGESAGGASTGFHILSPMSEGLFQRAILMSGVPLCDWSLAFEPRRRAFALGKELGIQTDDPRELLDFLQNVPVEKLVNINPVVLGSELATNSMLKMFPFTPVVEIEKDFGKDHFLNEEAEQCLRKEKVNKVDIMIGHTDEETLIAASFIDDTLAAFDKYAEMVVPRELLLKCTPAKVLQLHDRIKNHYFGPKAVLKDKVREFISYANHTCFVYNVHRFARQLPEFDNTARYFYIFSCVSERNIYGNHGAKYGITGASHLDDLVYLFDPKHANLSIDKTGKSYKMINQTCELFSNFSKYGNPTPDMSLGVAWPQYNKTSEDYLDIGEVLTPGQQAEHDALNFWKTIYDEAAKNPTPDMSLGVAWPQYNKTSEDYLDIGEVLTPGQQAEHDALNFWKTIYDEAAK